MPVPAPDADGLVRLAGGAFLMGANPHEQRGRDELVHLARRGAVARFRERVGERDAAEPVEEPLEERDPRGEVPGVPHS